MSYELWKGDGTVEGTVPVMDINLGSASSSPSELTNVDGTLFIAAHDGASGPELWKSDGTAEGTVLVRDIMPVAQGFVSLFPDERERRAVLRCVRWRERPRVVEKRWHGGWHGTGE